MKKFISVFLCTVVFTVNVIFTPYVTTVYASGIVTDIVKSISLDNIIKMVRSLYKVGYRVHSTFHGSPGYGDDAAISESLDSIWGEDSAVNKWLQTKLFPFMDANRNIDLTKDDCPISYNNEKQLVEFNPTFTTELNQQLQDSIHALDGYYLYEPDYSYTFDNFCHAWKNDVASKTDIKKFNTEELSKCISAFNKFSGCFLNSHAGTSFYNYYFPDNVYFYLSGSYVVCSNGSMQVSVIHSTGNRGVIFNYSSLESGKYFSSIHSSVFTNSNYWIFLSKTPIKVFYSEHDLQQYLNNGRIYIPQLPSGGFKVNIKYINNTTNLPDITYNITTENKTETEIQNQFDTTINNYLNGLDDFTDGGGTTNPTPTPSGGGSGGDFGDGITPTPKPDFTDGSLTDTNTLLQKILDKLTEFSANHDKLAKTITDYIEKNSSKLEEILIAIQALSDGKTETEQNGCKYDFTALSKYLTDLWNNSDKKFDEMVKLLEENNKYQQKLVDSLNEIKALLIADTVMDFFKDRSQETAEKAKDKFPTSIPWDISLVLNSMSAEPKNPKFSLPIKVESFKINETIDIDLSTDEWEKLAKTCRYILSVTFILFLIHLSRKLFSNGGDD